MIDAALVLPEVTVGITEASITRKPETPRTRSSGSTTDASSAPIRAVPTGWKMVVAMSPAARARSASLSIATPGLNSSGWKRANGAWSGWHYFTNSGPLIFESEEREVLCDQRTYFQPGYADDYEYGPQFTEAAANTQVAAEPIRFTAGPSGRSDSK